MIKSLFSIPLCRPRPCPSLPDPILTSISITSHMHESEIGVRLKHFAGSFSQIPSHCSSSLFPSWSLSHPSVVRPSRKGNESPKASELGTRQHPLLSGRFSRPNEAAHQSESCNLTTERNFRKKEREEGGEGRDFHPGFRFMRALLQVVRLVVSQSADRTDTCSQLLSAFK